MHLPLRVLTLHRLSDRGLGFHAPLSGAGLCQLLFIPLVERVRTFEEVEKLDQLGFCQKTERETAL